MTKVLCVDSLGPQLTGIGRYCLELARWLPRYLGDDLVFHRGGREIRDPEALLADVGVARSRYPFQRRIQRFSFRHRYRDALFHGPNYFLPPWAETGIVTVHDLSALRFPDMHPAERVRQFERRFSATLAIARHVIADTAWNRQELIETLGLAPDRVSAIPLGISPTFHPEARGQSLLPAGLTEGGYGLCVATLEPRKGLSHALAAWSLLPPSLRARFPLVVAGADGWPDPVTIAALERAEREGWLKRLGYVEEAHLPALYAGARLFLFPSVYEGFGLPPLEAMACGVPTIVADRACLPEVTGGAAELVDPLDTEAFAEAIEIGLSDDQWRARAREAGLLRAAQFTWTDCVQRTAAIYRTLT